jgi:type II secretory pathway predicted ATPase ExeA
MYETFFGLKRRPFLFVPDVESYFSVEFMEKSRRDVERTLQNGEGISLVFGASGTGKTLLMRIIRQSLDSEYTVALVSNSRLETPRALFLQLFHDLHIPASNGETVELRLQLLDFARQEPTRGVVLLFDDAQYLCPSVLEEIRSLTDSTDGSVPFFRAVLAGTMDFEEKLTLPNLEVFNQRVASRCYLDSFSGEETSRYIIRQTDNLRIDTPQNASPPLFTEEAKRRIYQLTDGLPRLINQLCGTALQLAAERKVKSVDGALVNAAWNNLQHIESNNETELTGSAAQEAVISPAQIEEIVDQKRKTFRLRQFDSVEFGTLTDSEMVETEVLGTNRSFHENEYKPPYPEDDDDDEFAELEQKEPEVYRMPGVSDKSRLPAKLPLGVPVRLVIVPKRQFALDSFNEQHLKFRRRYLLQKIQHRLGLFAGVLRKTEAQQPVPPIPESNMNERSLQEYGAAVLEGRPPFVRKEPHYAYQTTGTPSPNVTYPDPKTGVPITLRWLPEKMGDTDRFGVSYTEFLNREVPQKGLVAPDKSIVQGEEPRTPRSAVPEPAAPVVRTSLGAHAVLPHRSGLEEVFEESKQVGGSAISLAELFRVDSLRIEESAEFRSLEATVQHQLSAVIRRITKAAEKIEQAAEVSERAGEHVSRAAEFVETEVKSALPTYTDLFRQWSEFQNMITAELESVRQRNPEPPQFRTFPPRRQVMIERTVSAIDVESLLR